MSPGVALVGYAAAVCTTLAFVPQVLKAWRSRHTADISLAMFLIFVLGISLWLVYGLALGDPALIGANSVTLVLAGTILYLKLRYG